MSGGHKFQLAGRHNALRSACAAWAMLACVTLCCAARGLALPRIPPLEQDTASSVSSRITPLELASDVHGEVAGGQRHVYSVAVAQGQFAQVIVEHRGPEFVARLIDGSGTVQAEHETAAGESRVVLEFVADSAAPYLIEVEPKYPKALTTQYRIRWDQTRQADEADRMRYQADHQIAESRRLYRAGDYAEADAAAESALQLRQKALGASHPDAATALNILGMICTAKSDYARAEQSYRQALDIREKAFGKDTVPVAEVLDNLAKLQNERARYPEAETLANESLHIREAKLGADHFLVAASLLTLADIAIAKGEYRSAQPFADRALATAAKWYGTNDLPYTDFQLRVARLLVKAGNYPRAEELYLQALATREEITGKESLATAEANYGVGYAYVVARDNLNAEKFTRRALVIEEKILGPDHLQLSAVLDNLALVLYHRSDYEDAEALYSRSLAIERRVLGPNHPVLGITLNLLGLVEWGKHDYPKAKALFEEALELYERVYGPDSISVAYPLGNLGIIAKETGDYQSAEAIDLRALGIFEMTYGKWHPDVRAPVETLALLYRDRGDYGKAEPLFLRVMEMTERSLGPDHPDISRHLENLAQLYAATGNNSSALRCLERLRSNEEKTLPLNLAIGSERQKLAYFQRFTDTLDKIVSFHMQLDRNDQAAAELALTTLLQRKGRVLDAMADNLSALRKRAIEPDRALFARFDDVTTELATLVLKGPQRIAASEHLQRIKVLSDEREKLEDELSRRSEGYYEKSTAVTRDEVQKSIPADAALVEFTVYRPFDPKAAIESPTRYGAPRYAVYVVASQGAVRWRDLGSAQAIEDSINDWRKALQDPNRRDVTGLARTLDKMVLQPVRDMTGSHATRLLISPDGQLDLIPFDALVDEQGRYAIEAYKISYLTTGRDLLRMQVARASRSAAVIIADPQFGEPVRAAGLQRANVRLASIPARRGSVTTAKGLSDVYFAPLPGTAQEARAIQALFPDTTLLTGAKATKAALKQVDAPAILHIATHGFFLEDAGEQRTKEATGTPLTRSNGATMAEHNPLLRAGLAMAGANLRKDDDGLLTALEASNLGLWGTRLVTLSACDTGLGEVKNGEGVYGLRRAFFLAGAESVVMSLWPVSDYVTRGLMTAYYTRLHNGAGRADALRDAQLATLHRHGRQHPYYWASFIAAGEWASLDGRR